MASPTPSLTNPKREDERVDEALDLLSELKALDARMIHTVDGRDRSIVGWSINEVSGFKGLAFMADVSAALASARPSPGDPVRAALEADECLFGDFDEADYKPDLASTIAAEVMGLKWSRAPATGYDDGDGEQMSRYGDVQEAVGRVLNVARTQTHSVLVGQTLSVSTPTGEGEGHAKRVAEVVELILQEQWDEWVGDTDCFPGDFTITRGPKLWFKAGAWARLVAERVATAVVPTAPTSASKSSGEEA